MGTGEGSSESLHHKRGICWLLNHENRSEITFLTHRWWLNAPGELKKKILPAWRIKAERVHRALENPLFSNCLPLTGIIFSKTLLCNLSLWFLWPIISEEGHASLNTSLTSYPPAVKARNLPESQPSSEGRPDWAIYSHLHRPLLPSLPREIDLVPFTGALK